MKKLSLYIKESLLAPEDDLVNKPIKVAGVYIIEHNNTMHYIFDLQGKEITPINFNWDVDCFAIIIDDDHSYYISKESFCSPMFSKNKDHLVHNNTSGCYIKVSYTDVALSNDMNGYDHTHAIANEFDDAAICKKIIDYKTDVVDDWYLPSIGEIMLISKYQKIINRVLQAFNSYPVKGCLLTSTHYNENNTWVYNCSFGYPGKSSNNNIYYSKAIAKFDLEKMK